MQVPDHLVAEIVDGVLYTSPRPASPHANAASVLGAEILVPFHGEANGPGRPGGWWILDEPELHFAFDVLVPDHAGWRRERMPVLPNTVGFTLAPDWVCEVISPSTGRLDRNRKMQVYAREGIPHFWIVDPILRTLEVYRLDGDGWRVAVTHGGDDVARIEPFTAIELALGRWWIPLPPDVR